MSTINERFRQLRESKGLSQEDFANKAHRTRSEIKNIEYGKTSPKEEVIQSVCCAYNVNETWLRTGMGAMYLPASRNAEIEAFMNDVMHSESDNFRRRLVTVLTRLDADEWKLLEQMALKLAAEAKSSPQLQVIKIAGRDGSFTETVMTDDEAQKYAAELDKYPDVPDDL